MLYLGEINAGQRGAWCRVIEAFDETRLHFRILPRRVAFPVVPGLDLLGGLDDAFEIQLQFLAAVKVLEVRQAAQQDA